ncbi:MAG: hypothetical protein ACLT3D_05090 [Lawsonibacter sp.]
MRCWLGPCATTRALAWQAGAPAVHAGTPQRGPHSWRGRPGGAGQERSWTRAVAPAGELPLTRSRKLMTTVHPRPEGGFRVFVKGAPDVLLERRAAGPRGFLRRPAAGEDPPGQRGDGRAGPAGAGGGLARI